MRILERFGLPLAVYVGAALPLVGLVWNLASNPLLADPIRASILWTGKTALILLVLTLASTPLNTVFGWRAVLRVRRALGLYAFAYAALHFLIFVGVDYAFDPALLGEAIGRQTYVLLGLGAGVILFLLALTSTQGWKKRLGHKWKRLHQGIYFAAPLAIAHFVWLVKVDIREPLAYGAIVAALLLARVPWLRARVSQVRYRWQSRAEPARMERGEK